MNRRLISYSSDAVFQIVWETGIFEFECIHGLGCFHGWCDNRRRVDFLCDSTDAQRSVLGARRLAVPVSFQTNVGSL